jgi:hypothetical protein
MQYEIKLPPMTKSGAKGLEALLTALPLILRQSTLRKTL